MIIKNLRRRKGRTLLTILGISIGVAAIVALGALADGVQAGYDSFITGSKADLVLSQAEAQDEPISSLPIINEDEDDEDIGIVIEELPDDLPCDYAWSFKIRVK